MISKVVLFSTLFAITVAQTPLAPTCYSGSSHVSDCSQFIDTFCNSVYAISNRIGDSTSRCFTLSNNRRCDFTALNTYSLAGSPLDTQCKTVLRNVANKCTAGGYGKMNSVAYTFTVDPNKGSCNASPQGGSRLE